MKFIRSIRNIVVLIFVFCTTVAATESIDQTLVGTANPEKDIPAVQSAVDKGGVINLKGKFDFGEKGYVKINKDVKIVGELNAQGKPSTQIKGGYWTFRTELPKAYDLSKMVGPKISIRGIHFDGAVVAPMNFPYTSGTTITNNLVTNVTPAQPRGFIRLLHIAVNIGSFFGNKSQAVTGYHIFVGNTVDLKCDNPSATLAAGPWIVNTWGASIIIKDNTIKNSSRNSIEVLESYLDEEGKGIVIIQNNKIITSEIGIKHPNPNTPNGIVAGWFINTSAGTEKKKRSPVIITGNEIEARGKTSVGIIVLSDDAVITNNKVVINGDETSGGIGLIGSNAIVIGNTINGTGGSAIFTATWKSLLGAANHIYHNDTKSFKSPVADFVLLTNDNRLICDDCKVMNQGQSLNKKGDDRKY